MQLPLFFPCDFYGESEIIPNMSNNIISTSHFLEMYNDLTSTRTLQDENMERHRCLIMRLMYYMGW